MRRSRFVYFVLSAVVLALGLASRRYAAVLPVFVGRYAGDTLWALMVFVGIGLLAPLWSTFRLNVTALAVSYSVEISQLYHGPWIESVRHTWLGGLVLGYGFLWSDIACYTVGVALGALLDIAIRRGDDEQEPYEGEAGND
jgi:hypothetical protein